jgi:DNA-binding NtrC family response regulator
LLHSLSAQSHGGFRIAPSKGADFSKVFWTASDCWLGFAMLTKRVLWVNQGSSPALDNCPPKLRPVRMDPPEALRELETSEFEAIVLEFPAPGWTPEELFGRVQRSASDAAIVVRDSAMSAWDAVRWARLGAYPATGTTEDITSLITRAAEEQSQLRRRSRRPDHTAEWESLMVGNGREMCLLRQMIRMVGGRRCTVLITGETGTGKELAARSLHLAGPRGRGPLVALNCSAVPEALLEAELFGYVRGAFTGALQTRVGRFEQAHGGTLFLDEIGDLPLDLQAKLLRVLQEREFQRLGSSDTIRVDIRVVAATNCDLAQKMDQGRFREDLYYRLNVVPLNVPPLRRRLDDVPLLARHFVEKICRSESIPVKVLTPQAIERLSSYSWPGNVRQLENAVEMAIALSGDREVLSAADFPLGPPAKLSIAPAGGAVVSLPDTGLDYQQTLATIERSILEQALEKTGGNKKAAAEMLGLKRTTLCAKVRNMEALAACG